MSDLTKILDQIEKQYAPDVMPSKTAALEWLRDLIGELEMRCEALREEIRVEEGHDDVDK